MRFSKTVDWSWSQCYTWYGASVDGELIMAITGWPHKMLFYLGTLQSSAGAALQALAGAPRLLNAIAKDGIIPALSFFSVTNRGEPFRCQLLTFAIAEIGIIIAKLDYVAPIVTQFFLICYGFINLACTLQTLLRSPHWRPRFRCFHWTQALTGMSLCLVLMFIVNWKYALPAIIVAGMLYKYIEFKGAERDWGDGMQGLAMSAATYALLRLKGSYSHTKNWRPQLLLMMKLDEQLQPKMPRMLSLASQLKAGRGLTLIVSVIEGNFQERYDDAIAVRKILHDFIEWNNVKGFSDIVIAKSISEGLSHAIQSSGLGQLRHNTVVLGWPSKWQSTDNSSKFKIFINTMRNIAAAQQAMVLMKNASLFPKNTERLSGTIDVWWIVHDGGLLMLLPFLLKKHRVWSKCTLRIFTVAQMTDNSIRLKTDLQKYMYDLRIDAEVEVIEMGDHEISAYIYERTLQMEQRSKILRELGAKRKGQAQTIIDQAHLTQQRRMSLLDEGEDNEEDSFRDPSVISFDDSENRTQHCAGRPDLPDPMANQSPSDMTDASVESLFDEVIVQGQESINPLGPVPLSSSVDPPLHHGMEPQVAGVSAVHLEYDNAVSPNVAQVEPGVPAVPPSVAQSIPVAAPHLMSKTGHPVSQMSNQSQRKPKEAKPKHQQALSQQKSEHAVRVPTVFTRKSNPELAGSWVGSRPTLSELKPKAPKGPGQQLPKAGNWQLESDKLLLGLDTVSLQGSEEWHAKPDVCKWEAEPDLSLSESEKLPAEMGEQQSSSEMYPLETGYDIFQLESKSDIFKPEASPERYQTQPDVKQVELDRQPPVSSARQPEPYVAHPQPQKESSDPDIWQHMPKFRHSRLDEQKTSKPFSIPEIRHPEPTSELKKKPVSHVLEAQHKLASHAEAQRMKLRPTGSPSALVTPGSVQYTFSSGSQLRSLVSQQNTLQAKSVKRMHNAVQLNKKVIAKSGKAELVIMNLPPLPESRAGQENYMSYLEVLTEGLGRVLLIRGSNKEVVTIFN